MLVSDESRVDGLVITRNGTALDPALWNRAAPVDGGTYRIAGSAPGHEEWSTTVEVANERDKVDVEVPRFKELRKLVLPAPQETPHDPGDEPAPKSPGMFTTKRKIAVGVAGLGVAAAAAGALLGIQAKSLEDDAYALCPDPAAPCADAESAQSKLDSAQQKALTANIAYGVAGAAIVGAAVLWFTGGPSAESPEVMGARVGGSAGPGVAKLDLTWSF